MRKHNYYLAKKNGQLDKVKERAINERIRKRYSVSNEFAILRQRDEKPEEFEEYYKFVEQIKEEVNKECDEYIEKYSKIYEALQD